MLLSKVNIIGKSRFDHTLFSTYYSSNRNGNMHLTISVSLPRYLPYRCQSLVTTVFMQCISNWTNCFFRLNYLWAPLAIEKPAISVMVIMQSWGMSCEIVLITNWFHRCLLLRDIESDKTIKQKIDLFSTTEGTTACKYHLRFMVLMRSSHAAQ